MFGELLLSFNSIKIGISYQSKNQTPLFRKPDTFIKKNHFFDSPYGKAGEYGTLINWIPLFSRQGLRFF